MRRHGYLTPLLWCWLVACDDEVAKTGPSATASASASAEEVTTVDDEPVETVDDTPGADPEQACAPVDPSLKAMQLLRLSLASGIEGKDPKDRLEVARAGRRVYAHLRMRNRSGRDRCVRVRFRVKDEQRTEVTLKIGHSWSWRTWAYATLRDDDRGRLEIEVVDDQGATIVKRSLAIVE